MPPGAMEMNNLPTASPLQAGRPVYVALVPGVDATEGSMFTVVSGYGHLTGQEAAEIHELSRQVLQLAMVNCVVAVSFRLIAAGLAIAKGSPLVAEHILFVLFSFWVMYLGVQGVKLRNPPLCGCCNCGHLTGFYIVYIVFSVLSAISVLFCLIFGLWGYFILQGLFLALYGVTADKARRLLDALERSGTDASSSHRCGAAIVPPGAAAAPGVVASIPVAAATEVGAMPVAAVAAPAPDVENPSDAKIKADAAAANAATATDTL